MANLDGYELNAGVNISILAGSVGAGQLKFTSVQPPVGQFSINLDHRYFGDEAQGGKQLWSPGDQGIQ